MTPDPADRRFRAGAVWKASGGIGLLCLAIGAAIAQLRPIALGLLIVSTILILWSLKDLPALGFKTRRSPQIPQAELTRRVLAWADATDEDLASNRQLTLSPAQQLRVQPPQLSAEFALPAPPVQRVVGRAKLFTQQQPNRPMMFYVEIDRVVFQDPDPAFHTVFVQTVWYRIFFVPRAQLHERATKGPWMMLSGEALEDV